MESTANIPACFVPSIIPNVLYSSNNVKTKQNTKVDAMHAPFNNLFKECLLTAVSSGKFLKRHDCP